MKHGAGLRAGTTGRVVILIIVVVSMLSAFLVTQIGPPGMEVRPNDLQPGDVIFVDIYTGWTHSNYWDHLAIYVGSQPGLGLYPGPAVVEATWNGGIALTSLTAFLRRDHPAQMTVRRLKDMPSRQEIVTQAVEYAVEQVGKPFDFAAMATLPLKLDSERLHCVELVWRAYGLGGVDLDADGGLFLYPDDIYYSSQLEPA